MVLFLLGLHIPMVVPQLSQPLGPCGTWCWCSRARAAPGWEQTRPGRWNIPGGTDKPRHVPASPPASSTFPFLLLAGDLAAKAVFHFYVNIWKKKGGK